MNWNWKIVRKFLNQIDIGNDSECWLWTGKTGKNGLGWIRRGGKKVSVRRVAWILYNQSEIQSHLSIRQTCDNDNCLNPKHLKLVRLGARGEKNPNCRMSEAKVKEMKRLFMLGVSRAKAAKTFNVSWGTADRIFTGKDWGWVKPDEVSETSRVVGSVKRVVCWN